MQKCKHPKCERETIANSNFCSIHIDKKILKSRLIELEGVSNDFSLIEVNLNGYQFKNIYFDKLSIIDSSLKNIRFVGCKFKYSNFEHSQFENVEFENCYFDITEWTGVLFEFNSLIIKSKFNNCRFSTCHFQDKPKIENTDFIESEFISCTFYDMKEIKQLVFNNCLFSETSFSELYFSNISFDYCDFKKTNFSNSIFKQIILNNLQHDFALAEYPTLCVFKDLELIKTNVPDEFYKWNNINENDKEFYYRIIDLIKKEDHPNHLQELNICIERLYDLGENNNRYLINTVENIYNDKLKKQISNRDLIGISIITEQMNDLPNNIFANNIPFAQLRSNNQLENSKIKISLNCNYWTLENISIIQNKLFEIEKNIGKDHFIVDSIFKGSLKEIIVSNYDTILLLGKCLSFFATNIFLFTKGTLFLQENILKNKKLKQDLELGDIEIISKRLDLNKKIKEDKLETINKINQLIDERELNYFFSTENGKATLTLVKDLSKMFNIDEIEIQLEAPEQETKHNKI